MHPLKAILNVRKREIPLVILMFLYFFLIITVFWVLKPIKKDVLVHYYDEDVGRLFFGLDGPEAELIAKLGNIAVAYVAVVAFTMLARHFRRHQLSLIFSGFSVACLVLFAVVVPEMGRTAGGARVVLGDSAAAVWSFYLFGDLFNTLMVATFFAFLNDSVTPAQAKRLYGPIILGGLAGGAFGSLFVFGLTKEEVLSNSQWMWLCAGTTLVIALIALGAGLLVQRDPPPETKSEASEEPEESRSAATEGARLVFRSRYLLAIVAIVALYEIVSTILDFQMTRTVKELTVDFREQVSLIYVITNCTGLAIQLFLTTAILQRLGVKFALLVMPAAILLNSGLFLAIPILWIGSFLSVSDNALNYSLNQSARETLYTPTTRDQKYKAKAFIDMFVQRAAKGVGVFIALGMSIAIEGLSGARWLSLVTVALVGVWIVAARYAGQRFRDMTGEAQARESK